MLTIEKSGNLNGLNAINAIKALKAAALSVIPSAVRREEPHYYNMVTRLVSIPFSVSTLMK